MGGGQQQPVADVQGSSARRRSCIAVKVIPILHLDLVRTPKGEKEEMKFLE
jgi:hypothetical protein